MQTKRQELTRLLEEHTLTAREISQEMGIPEREVYHHLSHIARSAASQGRTLNIESFACLGCGHVFEDRKRFSPPGRCPRCKGTRLEKPRYRIG